jgi:hypothetical protein
VVTELPGVTLDSVLKQYVPMGAAIILRLDAEGAEYAILDQALTRSGLLCEYAKAYKADKPPLTRVQPLDPTYPRVHVAVKWNWYLEAEVQKELQAQELMAVSGKTPQGGKWAKELEEKMKDCGIQVRSAKGDVN